jgi:hypothetical protein
VDPLRAEEKLWWVRGGGALGDGRERWVDDGLRQPVVVVACSSSARGVMASCVATWAPHFSYVVATPGISYSVWRFSEPPSLSLGSGWQRGGMLVRIEE